MGQSSTGLLYYGYDLGGEDRGWNLANLSTYDEPPTVPWWTYDEDDEDNSFADALTVELYRKYLGREVDWAWDSEAEKQLKVEHGLMVETYGHYDYPGHVLATRRFVAYGYGSEIIELDGGSTERESARVLLALEHLGLTPIGKPGWVLASSFG